MTSSPDTVRDLFARFSGQPVTIKVGVTPDVDKLLAMPGDAERDRKVFPSEPPADFVLNVTSSTSRGTDFGPDLNKIGMKYQKADMLDNILHPSKTIVQGYETWVVKTKTGNDPVIGFIVSKSETEVVIKDQSQKLTHVKTEEIEKMASQPISAMPEGVIADLEPQQAADLLEFLAARK